MSEQVVTIVITPEERRIISSMRDLPPSPLKDLLAQVMARLVELVREPSCPEMQADGVPCKSSSSDCAECRKLMAVLETLQKQLTPA